MTVADDETTTAYYLHVLEQWRKERASWKPGLADTAQQQPVEPEPPATTTTIHMGDGEFAAYLQSKWRDQ